MVDEKRAPNAEKQLASYFASYEPTIAKLGKGLRSRLRDRLPGLHEIVYFYETQNSLVISYSPTDKGYEGLCSIAVDPRCVRLCFGQGAQLAKSDPQKLLQGRGKTVRHVALETIADFDRPEIEALLVAALQLAKLQLDASATGSVILRVEAQQQRAKRAAKAATPTRAASPAKPTRKAAARKPRAD